MTLLSALSPLEVLFLMRKVHSHPCECQNLAPFRERASFSLSPAHCTLHLEITLQLLLPHLSTSFLTNIACALSICIDNFHFTSSVQKQGLTSHCNCGDFPYCVEQTNLSESRMAPAGVYTWTIRIRSNLKSDLTQLILSCGPCQYSTRRPIGMGC
jgi:hypothetical protein